MRAFIDTQTGTWGSADGIVFLDLNEDEINQMNEWSDSEIIAHGHEWGVAPVV